MYGYVYILTVLNHSFSYSQCKLHLHCYFPVQFMRNARRVNHVNNKVSIFNILLIFLSLINLMVCSRSFDNPLPSFVDICSYLIYNFLH